MLSNIRIVMINTFHPGNIGAAARAMKNMGLSELVLVEPRLFPDPEASSRAASATDLLDNARIVSSLSEAIADCPLVIGASARSRSFPWPMLDAEQCATKAVAESAQGPVAIVFGRERMGLHNDELMQCHFHVAIPSNPDSPVLNVSSAIQVICYEIWKTQLSNENEPETLEYPTQQQMENFYQHLEQTLEQVGFLIPQHPGKTMTKLRRLFNRTRPETMELNMLRGILSAIGRDKT
ncbi:tRNA (cytosine(32)/uridine(32)-2'-O)-methyltransferase TrmJ [Motiliproteus coralliicola]|uniref:tRNA (cytidine/uridine-2'-O-)-methyltransferase TrmJ n=1 Tax=Motiliproteus coralliicola TaxID=2283196 RepID=A0A369WTV6_9GAMM|nr:tRNA (cytosine(32)/uridine(32)-2'-O)-methyltransferase TrmJ [Motiliproteus coralliicola]RDE24489.1 tRNA (cytosine(32)/uridine(32)-2'-O)-methyltransferase TrmJ [Motiliproteus coralliicola]